MKKNWAEPRAMARVARGVHPPLRKLVDVDFGPPPLPRRSGGDHPGEKRDATILHDQVVASDLQPTLFRLTVERIISRIKCFLRKITASHLNLL